MSVTIASTDAGDALNAEAAAAINALIAASGGGVPGVLTATAHGLIGDGTTDDAPALATLLASIGSGGGTVYFTPGKTYRLATTLSTPSTVTLWLPRGAMLKVDGVTVRIRGGVDAGRYQVFQYVNGGSISFIGATDVGIVTSLNRPDVYPQWWGAIPYQHGTPVDVTAGFANMMAAIAPFYGVGKTAANASGWTTANISLGEGIFRVSAAVGQAALSPPPSSRGFTMTGAGIENTMIECADGAGVAKATPAMAMLDLNGQFFARLENFSMGGVAGQGNYSYGVYYHRNANTSALGSSQLTVNNVEITDPWIIAAWRFGSDLTYDPSNTGQTDNVVTDRLMAHRNTGYANDGYCQYGIKQGVGFTTNTLNFSHNGMDIIGCGIGLLNSATNGRVTNWEMAANDIDFQINQYAVAYFEVDGGRSEASRKAIDSISSAAYASTIKFKNCLWHLNALANDPVDGTPDWAKITSAGTWELDSIEVSAITNTSLQPSLRVASNSRFHTVILRDVRVQYATPATFFAFNVVAPSAELQVQLEGLVACLDVNDNVAATLGGHEGPALLVKNSTVYLRRMGTWWGETNDPHGVDAGIGRLDYGVACAPNFLAHSLTVQPISTTLQNPHVTTTDPAGGTNYLVAFVGYDGKGTQSTKGPNSSSIQCLAEASLSATHCLTVNLEDALTLPVKGHAFALTYDVIYSVDGGTTWKLAPGGGRVPYATFAAAPFLITGTGTSYTLPTSDATGVATFNGPVVGLTEAVIAPVAFTAKGNIASALALPWTQAQQKFMCTATVNNGVVTIQSIPAGGSMVVQLNSGAGSLATTFAVGSGMGTLRWMGGSAPTTTLVANKLDEFLFVNNGTDTIGYTVGLGA